MWENPRWVMASTPCVDNGRRRRGRPIFNVVRVRFQCVSARKKEVTNVGNSGLIEVGAAAMAGPGSPSRSQLGPNGMFLHRSWRPKH